MNARRKRTVALITVAHHAESDGSTAPRILVVSNPVDVIHVFRCVRSDSETSIGVRKVVDADVDVGGNSGVTNTVSVMPVDAVAEVLVLSMMDSKGAGTGWGGISTA